LSRSTINKSHRDQWYNKSIHGQWPKLVEELQADASSWLQRAHLKSVTEAMITAAQDQALNTHWLGYHILGTSNSDLCRRCHQFSETIEHVVAGCPSLAQTVYLDRHNAVTSAVHWNLCGLCGFERSSQWWYHHPEPVLDSPSYKLLYDFNIYTDRGITARRPDLVMVDKMTKCTTIIDVACVMDRHVVAKHQEKIDKYLDLAIELQALWNTKVEIFPLVFGARGALPGKTVRNFELLQLFEVNAHQLQKTVLLKTDLILRKQLSL